MDINAYDICTGNLVSRPAVDAEIRYDFDIKKHSDKHWRYVHSSNYIEEFDTERFKIQLDHIEGRDCLWRIIDSKTGKVVKTNDKTLQRRLPPVRK